MLETITGETIASEVEMVRTSFKGTILIVEGEKDEHLLNKFIDDSSCNVIISHGKENSISAIEILNREGKKGILALVDADYWRIENFNHGHQNLLTTDVNDTECMVFDSPALERVVAEYCSKNKVCKIGNLRLYVYERAAAIGLLRLTSQRESLNLVFKGIDYGKITRKDCIDVELTTLVRHINQLTSENRTKKNIEQKIRPDAQVIKLYNKTKIDTKHVDNTFFCCGHDLMGLFAIALRKLIGTLNAAIADNENVERIFRLSYDYADFIATSLFSSISKWEKINAPYRILRSL